MRLGTRAKIAATLLCGVAISLAMPMLPALAQSSQPVPAIKLLSPAKVAVRGAVALAPVQVTCPNGDQVNVSMQLSERSGHVIASGFGNTNLTCTGHHQTVTVPVIPTNAPFVVGPAFGQANFFDCTPQGNCVNPSDQGTVKLVKK